ncbi:DEAD/DEAH box helicase [Hyphomicrobium denitrificans 1NES1]|uniref:DEAD-box ATP-dependent RNA helicase RhpA n=1 Tax=Hyphomicrobium denitrificans 1NES1 TaxID=670307 RepID=N0BE01_9HYPH|nr:DEAD/DEAH box helicase [Hyphomicrobium denitrificans]AGK58736.1 DEAD/DEAH box helicase [Hyphomicrobium denitrificans 1NES1]
MDSKTFADLGLSPKVQAAVTAAGYVNPTPIQAAAIPVALTGRDVLGIAQTGTGKTASFVLPMITRLEAGRARARMPRSLILAPTRELAAQVAQSFEKYGTNHKLSLALLIGGVSMDDQVKKLDRGVDVLIATPGRLLDHFGRGRVMLMGVEILVIDEADRMLDMGFIPDIEKICKLLPPRRQTLFFSATMPPEITRLVDQFLKDPMRIEVAKPATTAKTITQRFVYCQNGEDWAKREMLRELIRDGNVKNAIIFCNRKRDVAVLYKSLSKHGFNAGALHGDMDQTSRMDTLDKFRNGEIMLLAASDVAARGLDIPDVSHVFNFDLPWAADDYVHRIGRTGRAGREGYSASLVSPDDLKFVADIEKVTGETAIWLGDPPSEEDIAGAGKRRRGRGGRGASQGKSGRPHNGREARRSEPKKVNGVVHHHGEREGKGERPQAPPQQAKRERPRANNEQAPRDKSQKSAPRPRAADSWTDEPKAPRRSPSGEHVPSAELVRKPQQAPKGDNRVGFAENIPAFMRRPARPVKVPGRG